MDAPETPDAPGQGRCPRCHGSLEEGEQYICCAGQELEWHCTSCQKIYEGYAFPFGLCSACGGKLARKTNGASQDTETQRTIQEALEIELGGMSFYRRGAELTDDPELETLFRQLAEMEQEHIAILARRYHVQPPDPEDVTLKPEVSALFAGHEKVPTTTLEVLGVALSLEKHARDFFTERSQKLPRGSAAWRLCRELEAEEYEHVAMIETEIKRRSEGRPGLL